VEKNPRFEREVGFIIRRGSSVGPAGTDVHGNHVSSTLFFFLFPVTGTDVARRVRWLRNRSIEQVDLREAAGICRRACRGSSDCVRSVPFRLIDRSIGIEPPDVLHL
jgi:hypothetical protein